MELNQGIWSEEEFNTYLLLYCAMSNFSESAIERETILSKTTEETYKKVHREIEGDNDFQSIEKISRYLKNHHHSKGDMDLIMSDMKNLMSIDGDFDILEQNMFRILKKILKQSNS